MQRMEIARWFASFTATAERTCSWGYRTRSSRGCARAWPFCIAARRGAALGLELTASRSFSGVTAAERFAESLR
jgi:hypothetical protein